MTRGVFTSEFWLLALAMVDGTILAIAGVSDVTIGIVIGGAASYVVARAQVKKAAVSNGNGGAS